MTRSIRFFLAHHVMIRAALVSVWSAGLLIDALERVDDESRDYTAVDAMCTEVRLWIAVAGSTIAVWMLKVSRWLFPNESIRA